MSAAMMATTTSSSRTITVPNEIPGDPGTSSPGMPGNGDTVSQPVASPQDTTDMVVVLVKPQAI
jgi:hypothetical protein